MLSQGTQTEKQKDKQTDVTEEPGNRPMRIWTSVYAKDGTAKEGKNGLFSKWSWDNWVSTGKEARRRGREGGRGRKVYSLQKYLHICTGGHVQECL